MWTLAQLAQQIGARLEGDGDIPIRGCAGLEEAGEGDLSFLADPKEFERAAASRASAVILPPKAPALDRPVLRADNPRLAFARALALFAPDPGRPRGRHPTSIVHETARLGANVALGPYVVVEAGAVLEDDVCLYAGVYIGRESHIGQGTVIYPNAVIRERVKVGRRCVIHAGSVIGSDGFGYIQLEDRIEKIPQIGRVEIGDDVEIGSLVAIDRATCGTTRIGSGTKIDNLVQIGHNVQIGEQCLIAGLSGVAGSARLGNRVVMGGQTGISDHAEVGDGVILAGRGAIAKRAEPNTFLYGFPARPIAEQMRIFAAMPRLPEMTKTLRDLQARVEALEAELARLKQP